MPSPGNAQQLLGAAELAEASGNLHHAASAYEAAIRMAEQQPAPKVLCSSLRRLAVLCHHRDDVDRARQLIARAIAVAQSIPSDQLTAESFNTLGGLELTSGSLDEARAAFDHALALGGTSRQLRARVEQNLGIVANIQGRLYEALTRYERSLAAYNADGDEHGCAIAYHNLGRVSADRGQYPASETYYRESLSRAEASGDVYLQGQCLVSLADLDVVRQRYENARQHADGALALFGRIGARGAQSGAHRVLGMVYRETGRMPLAESQLRTAIELAVGAGSVLDEAETSRELALLYQHLNRSQEALLLLNTAYRLFRRLDARTEMVDVRAKVSSLESTYLSVVRGWGRAIDARDSNAPGHSERVARHALAAARALGLDEHTQTAIMLGTYLHDLGMVRVPQKILRKKTALSGEEITLVRRHPIWGVELLGDMDLPWDVKPIIRWHHERCDGTGYPDRLSGNEIPVSAQIVGLFDCFDAMTNQRPYQRMFAATEAIDRLQAQRGSWSPDVFEACMRVIAERPAVNA